jgi:hypothetical protein
VATNLAFVIVDKEVSLNPQKLGLCGKEGNRGYFCCKPELVRLSKSPLKTKEMIRFASNL